MANTYVALQTQTLGSAVSSVTFTGIDQTYTDLVLVMSVDTGGNIRVGNGSVDSTTSYSDTLLYGTGSVAGSLNRTSRDHFDDMIQKLSIINFQNYSNTTTYKTVLARQNNASAEVDAVVGLWRNTAAINTIYIYSGTTFGIGSTFTIYGIRAEGVSPAVKATGGTVYSDSTYYYHVFGSTGTFTPLQSLTADVLVVAGGGGAGGNFGIATGGGGGAGGLLAFTSQALTATGYSVTVGAGGSSGTSGNPGAGGSNGSNSQFAGLTASIGGGGGSYRLSAAAGNGGSGGGATTDGTMTGGTGTSGQGNAGGNAIPSNGGAGSYAGGGGGGKNAAGSSPTNGSAQGGNGGNGSSAYSSWGAATGTGENVAGTYYYAGGGGAGAGAVGSNLFGAGGFGGGGRGQNISGLPNTGGGGGSTQGTSSGSDTPPVGSGGSGVVIIRYSKA